MKKAVKKSKGKNRIEHWPIITLREKDVMRLLALGQSSRKIAEVLGISFHTVETHRKRLLIKFKTHSTVQMMLKAGRIMPPEFWI